MCKCKIEGNKIWTSNENQNKKKWINNKNHNKSDV
jgi:hypothetical protein